MSSPPAGGDPRSRRLRPEPARFWLAQAPAAWSWEAALWTDLSAARLGRSVDPGKVGPWPPVEPGDLTYLPPGASVPPGAAGEWLLQRLPGEAGQPAGAWVVWDLLPALLAGDVGAIEGLAPGSAVWPLVPGLTTERALWDAALPRLAAAGLRHVQPLAIDLDPAEKRRLAVFGDESSFAALFHGEAPSERTFSRYAARWGLAPFRRRPVPAGAGRRSGNRRLAGELLLAAELWLRCERAEAEGHSLLRAGRWVEESDHDVTALAREGNLDVVPWLDATSRAALIETARDGSSRLVADLEAEYLADVEGGEVS